MKISCLTLDAAMESLIVQNTNSRMIRHCCSVEENFSGVDAITQEIQVREAAWNELFNLRLAVYGVPE